MKQHNKRFKDKNGNPRYRLSEDEADIINKYRRIKQEAEAQGVSVNDVHTDRDWETFIMLFHKIKFS